MLCCQSYSHHVAEDVMHPVPKIRCFITTAITTRQGLWHFLATVNGTIGKKDEAKRVKGHYGHIRN